MEVLGGVFSKEVRGEVWMKVVVSYYADVDEHLVMFDTDEDYEKAEECRRDFLDQCDKEVDEGQEDKFCWESLMEYWELNGVMFTVVTVDYIHDLYGM